MQTADKYTYIWQTIQLVPLGSVSSYGQIATLAGLPGRARLVGRCIGQAPANLQLPWQRIIRANGELAFAADSESAAKQTQLLQNEGIVVKGNRVNMKRFQWQPSLEALLILSDITGA